MLAFVAASEHPWDEPPEGRRDVGRLVTTDATRIVSADASVAALLECDLDLLMQKPFAALVDLADRGDLRERIARLVDGEELNELRFRVHGTRGKAIDVVASVRALGEHPRERSRVVEWTIAPDPLMTADPCTHEFERQRLDRARELRTLAHELNQPLAAIVSYARGTQMRLQSGALSDADLRTALDVLVNEALRATEIVRALDRRWGTP